MPDTVSYLFLGLGIIALILGGYVSSLLLRYRRADQAEATLESLKK